jgi:hypothetical protein
MQDADYLLGIARKLWNRELSICDKIPYENSSRDPIARVIGGPGAISIEMSWRTERWLQGEVPRLNQRETDIYLGDKCPFAIWVNRGTLPGARVVIGDKEAAQVVIRILSSREH